MKLVGISAILGLASAGKIVVNDAPVAASAQNSATIADGTTPKYVYHADHVSDDYYDDLWHTTISLEEAPNAGNNIFDICNGIKGFNEGWCPKDEDQAKRTFAELVVQHFMPNSLAAGVLDESEVTNIPTFMLGYRVNNWADPPLTIPAEIDLVDATANRGTGGANDVYKCGPRNGVDSGTQNVEMPTIGFADNTTTEATSCTTLGNLGFWGDDFDKNFKLKPADCSTAGYVMCTNIWLPSGTTHSGLPIEAVMLNSTSVDIIKAAFDLLNDPNSSLNAVVEEEDDSTTTDTGSSGTSTTTEEVAEESNSMTFVYIAVAVVVVAVVAFLVLKKKE